MSFDITRVYGNTKSVKIYFKIHLRNLRSKKTYMHYGPLDMLKDPEIKTANC